MKKSSKHKLVGGTHTAAAAILASVFAVNVGGWLIDANDSENKKLAYENNEKVDISRTIPTSEEKRKSDINVLIDAAKVGGVILSVPLTLLFGGLAVRRFDIADNTKYREDNPPREIEELDLEESIYISYKNDIRSGSTRADMYPPHIAERYEREQREKLSDSAPS